MRSLLSGPRAAPLLLALASLSCWIGCDRESVAPASSPSRPGPPAAAPAPTTWTESAVHAVLKAANPTYAETGQFLIEQGQVVMADLANADLADIGPLRGMTLRALDLRGTRVRDLSPLRGLPLLELYLENTPVTDLTPLRGMPLTKLYLSETPVEDLSPLAGMPLTELNALGTRVHDLHPLRGLPLESLWLTEAPVSDISPLAQCPLVSLTLHRTQVRDLTPLAGSGLQRLHIGETPVSDLTPLQSLRLTRLIFSPSRITRGLDIARQMTSLRELGLTFEERMPPAQFWSQFPPSP